MNKSYLTIAVIGMLIACTAEEKPFSDLEKSVKISPTITKVTETNFEQGDAIGLTIVRENGIWTENAKLTYDGSTFSGDAQWYAGEDASTLKAYYPYSESIPYTFTVSLDQRNGTSSSDFVAAVKTGVTPSAQAIPVVFSHKLSRILLNLENKSNKNIEGVTLGGSVPTATVSNDFEIGVAQYVQAEDIHAFKASDTQYRVIAVPQTVAFQVKVAVDSKEHNKRLASVDLLSGKEYKIGIVVYDDDIKIVLSSEINDWNAGGDIPESEDNNIPEGAVDLGLSVYWATCNLGANSPEEYGDYYAWGEVEPYYSSMNPLIWKDGKGAGYDWGSYRWCNGIYNKLIKYCPQNESNYWGLEGHPDGKTLLELEDDVAHVKLGGKWRMPTHDEICELTEQCLPTWDFDRNGYIYTGPNGNSIFLPAAGRWEKTELKNADSHGYYYYSQVAWPPCNARFFGFYMGQIYIGDNNRVTGLTIRPVTQ